MGMARHLTVLPFWMKGIVTFEEEISQPPWQWLVPKRPLSTVSQPLKVERFLTQDLDQGLAPGLILGEGVGWVLGQTFQRILQEMNAVSDRIFQIELMGFLEEVHRQRQHICRGKGNMIAQDSQFVVSTREPQMQGGLEARQNVVGNLVGRSVLVHRHAASEV